LPAVIDAARPGTVPSDAPGEAAEMRILILNYEYPPIGGGAGVATAALAQSLVEEGIAVDVVTSGVALDVERRTSAREEQPVASGVLTLYRVRSRRIGVHEAGMFGAASYLLSALPLVRRLLRTHQYDAVHIFFSLPTGALLPFLNLRGVPVVLSLRGSDVPGYDPHNVLLQRAHQILAPLTRWIWRRADRVVAVCESLGQLTARTSPGLAYMVVPNGVDLALFRPSALPRREARPVRCLAVARLIERKGLGDLIRAFAVLERGRFELEIVGRGPDEELLRVLAQRLGIAHEVVFTGSLSRAAVAERYRQADLFTLPSTAEAFGNVFAEALAAGLPIVGSDVGGIPDLVEHGKNGLLVPPNDPAALARAIGYLAGDSELRQQMGRRNRLKAETTLEWSKVTQRYLSIYQGMNSRVHAASPLVAATTVSAT
jgi:glycosyltransferase involved in cell wall biosynthesis